ncbi:MAG: tRNA uridine-5-carboxymethylaminomethyl(34) synthesis GTPase MnmE [Bacteroidota bacterium]|jgi:tRNA modification GTPase
MSDLKWNDIIVALATPQGVGAIGVIRLSGKGSIELVDQLFISKKLIDQPANTLHVGLLMDDGVKLDEVVVSLFKGPRSYTGEDVVEISCHGSSFILQQIISTCIRRGARLATPGEFTLRAFLHGKMDLVQAEAVADLIASGTKAAQETALNQVRGGFSHVLSQLREELIKFSALIELELDFSQEDVEFADRRSLIDLLNRISITVNELLQSFQLGNVIKNGVSVAIIGKPNAGKSTLLNALLKENRAIVSAIAGTTRDTIEEILNIDGILFRLIDTAGIREGADEIEAIGVEKSKEKMRNADLVLYLFDATTETNSTLTEVVEELRQTAKQWLLVGNKVDEQQVLESKQAYFGVEDALYISAKEDKGLNAVRASLVDKVTHGAINTEQTIVTNARHFQALEKVALSIIAIQRGIDQQLPGDLLAIDIRQCLHYLGEITGQISNEDQLDFIFSKFCIGK